MHTSQANGLKLAFHDADTDTGTDTDILARIVARMSVSVSVSVSAPWNVSLRDVNSRKAGMAEYYDAVSSIAYRFK